MKDITKEYSEEIESLHRKAMNLAEEGDFLRRSWKMDEAKEKFASAFQVEKVIADILIDSVLAVKEIEPSRSTICLSAASLANDAGMIEERNKYANKVIELNFNEYFVDEAKSLLN